MVRLENKPALITGAASGIGRQSALLFASEGARVVIVDLNVEQGEDTVAEIKASAVRRLGVPLLKAYLLMLVVAVVVVLTALGWMRWR